MNDETRESQAGEIDSCQCDILTADQIARIVGGDLGVKAQFPQMKAGPAQVTVINNTGTPAEAKATQNDDGSINIYLEKAMVDIVSRGGPLNKMIKMVAGKGY